MLLVSPDGAFLGAVPLPGEGAAETLQMLQICADDHPVMLVEHDVGGEPLLGLRRFAGDGGSLDAFDWSHRARSSSGPAGPCLRSPKCR
jgi:hypothetical protein